MVTSVYIHIPFCKSKCKYCSFVSFCELGMVDKYIEALETEISIRYKGEELKTLYIGGGTPSLLSIGQVKTLISKFKFEAGAEITFELNPDDADIEYLKELKNLSINRLSIGSQSFNDNILKNIGRRHNSEQIAAAVKTAQKAGFDNISLDLIYGLPNQNLNDLKTDLMNFLRLNIQHISTYGLKIDEGSFWYKNPPVNLPDDDSQADMYELINKTLENKGFQRYEISNFSLKGYESKHNINYWNNHEYYGFGVAAHGYQNKTRYYNTSKLEDYIKAPSKHQFQKPLSTVERLEEEIFLGFRKTEGINVREINRKFNIDFDKKYAKTIDKYKELIERTPQGYRLNLQGVLISNIILSEFIDA